MKSFTKISMACLTILIFQVAILAQATTGSIRGSVVDSNGNVVANANVQVKNENTGVATTVVTNSEGSFLVSSLLPGSYTIATETTGFKRSVKTGVQVGIGVVTSASISLEVGAVTETVTVTASGDEALQTEQSQISGTLSTRKVEDLPSNGAGGGIDTLALLIPGVIANRTGGTNTNGTGLSVNGNRGRSNNFQIDGSDNNDLSVGGPALFVDFQDAVQEFQVITSNFDASVGRNQGAVVNIVTKGGTNDFHGSLFEYHQNNKALNARDNIQRRSNTPLSASLYNVFGGTIGGPIYGPHFGEGTPAIWKGTDRAFFFFAYQGIRNPASATGRTTSLGVLPSEFARLSSTFPGNALINTITRFSPLAIPGASVNTQITGTVAGAQVSTNLANTACARVIAVGATPAAGCTYTTPINPATGAPFQFGGAYDVMNFGSTAAPALFQAMQYERTVQTAYNENYWSLRFDVRPSNSDAVSFRYLKQKSVSKNGVGTISTGFLGDVPAGSTNYGGNWTKTFSSRFVNDFRLNYQKIGVEFGGGCSASTPGCIPGPASIDVAFTNINMSPSLGLSKTNTMAVIGPATNLPQGRVGKVYQASDNFSWSAGTHALTFGFEYKYLDTIVPFLPNINGAFAYNSQIRIANNAPSGLTVADGNPLLPFIEKDKYVFVQDNWKIRPNLTLNLGLRYENTGQPINVLNDATVKRESGSSPLFNPALPIAQRVVPRVPTDSNNYMPRIGFAWSPRFWKGLFGEGETVLRGGYSVAYDPAFYNILLNVATAAPAAASLTVPAASLTSTLPGQPQALPLNPFGNVVRAGAASSGLLPRGLLNPSLLAQTRVSSDFHAPFSRQFSFGVQRSFGRKYIAEVRYVGNQGRDLFQNINDNFYIRPLVSGFTAAGVTYPSFASLLPSGTTAQTCVDVAGTPDNEGACDGRLKREGGITTRNNGGKSDYHSLQARFNGRLFADSLNLGASYTFSKTMDNASEIFNFDGTSPNAQDPFCLEKCEYSLSALNRPHAFSMNFIYDVPFYKEQRGFVGRLLGGWQLNATYILTSGQAYSATQTFNGNFGLGNTYLTAGDRPFWGNPNAPAGTAAISQLDANRLFGIACNPSPCTITNTGFWSFASINSAPVPVAVTPNDVRFIFNGPGAAKYFGTPYGNVARYTEVGPKFNNLNMSVFKNVRVFESVRVQVRGEAFNVLNHPNPGFGQSSGGSLPTTNIQSAGATSGAFADFGEIAYSSRIIQLGIRIIF